jgi:DNA repair exonuclease SbcCD ATPase subunit
LGAITQISKTPDSYPKDLRDGAFSFDVQEGKEIKTYYFAAPSVQEREVVLRCIIEMRKWTLQLKRSAVDAPSLQVFNKVLLFDFCVHCSKPRKKQLAEAQRTIEALTEQLRKLREENSANAVSAAEKSSETTQDYDLLVETLEELRRENGRLSEALEEEKAQHHDLKKQFLEMKRQFSNIQAEDEEEEDPLDFFKKK